MTSYFAAVLFFLSRASISIPTRAACHQGYQVHQPVAYYSKYEDAAVGSISVQPNAMESPPATAAPTMQEELLSADPPQHRG